MQGKYNRIDTSASIIQDVKAGTATNLLVKTYDEIRESLHCILWWADCFHFNIIFTARYGDLQFFIQYGIVLVEIDIQVGGAKP